MTCWGDYKQEGLFRFNERNNEIDLDPHRHGENGDFDMHTVYKKIHEHNAQISDNTRNNRYSQSSRQIRPTSHRGKALHLTMYENSPHGRVITSCKQDLGKKLQKFATAAKEHESDLLPKLAEEIQATLDHPVVDDVPDAQKIHGEHFAPDARDNVKEVIAKIIEPHKEHICNVTKVGVDLIQAIGRISGLLVRSSSKDNIVALHGQ